MGGFVAATRQGFPGGTAGGSLGRAGDVTFDKITCNSWQVVDADGKKRIRAGTEADGFAHLTWYDKEEKVHIGAGTYADGSVLLPTNDLSLPPRP